MISKNLFTVLVLLFLSGCGYQSVYTNINSQNLSINKINYSGNKNISQKIINSARIVKNKVENSYSYDLNLLSTKLKEAVAKDALGNSSIFKMTINVTLFFKSENKKNISKKFTSSFSYNNSKNKFDLSQYEKIVENNLIEKLAEEIIIFINLQ